MDFGDVTGYSACPSLQEICLVSLHGSLTSDMPAPLSFPRVRTLEIVRIRIGGS